MLPTATREELFRRLQLARIVDPILDRQYAKEEEGHWRKETHENHRAPDWHMSFHASSFPLDPLMACGRKAVYGLMGLPNPEPTSRRLRSQAEAGLDIEDRIIRRFSDAGVLLSSPDPKKQTNFVARRYWLTGHGDAILLPPNFNRPHPVEIKTTSDAKLDEMLQGVRSFDPKHRAQLMAYIYFTRRAHKALGFEAKGLEPAEDGTIIYFSRDTPAKSAEFWVEWAEEEFQAGLDLLQDWRDSYRSGKLPSRPSHFMWGKEPCKWCDFKKNACKPDFEERVSLIAESHAVEHAKGIDSKYDFEHIYFEVVGKWSDR